MSAYPDKIFLVGFMGVGKSHWGCRLANQLSYEFVDLDEKVSLAADGRSIDQIFSEEGEEFFRSLESTTLRSIIAKTPQFVMACGGGTPCFLKNLEVMKQAGRVIWLRADVNELLPRLLEGKEQRPLIRDLDASQLESYLIRKMGDRNIFYQQAHYSVRESALHEQELVQLLLNE
jgi:shikimate kinase